MITFEELKEKKKLTYERYQPSGVSCPECGEELLVDTMIILPTYPPQRGYSCPCCKWHGIA